MVAEEFNRDEYLFTTEERRAHKLHGDLRFLYETLCSRSVVKIHASDHHSNSFSKYHSAGFEIYRTAFPAL